MTSGTSLQECLLVTPETHTSTGHEHRNKPGDTQRFARQYLALGSSFDHTEQRMGHPAQTEY